MIDSLKKVKKQSFHISKFTNEMKNEILISMAKKLQNSHEIIIEANALDILLATKNGLNESFIDRLTLTEKRIDDIANGLVELTVLHDPTGQVIDSFSTKENLKIKKITVPFGVVAMIYEARPNVTIDAIGICIKSGNCVVLRGSKDAYQTNKILTDICKSVLKEYGQSEDIIYLVSDLTREGALFLMKQREYIDVLIPRGGSGLIQNCVKNSKIPVIETGTGNCHVYVNYSADFNMALDILKNAKLQRVSVCNACESLLVDEEISNKFLPLVKDALECVEIFGCEKTRNIIDCSFASDEDFKHEYCDYKISVKVVKNIEEAINHINKNSSKHSETIVTNSEKEAEKFLQEIDSACVYHNVSTRFTDGFMFGFGAEIGISTQKLHARGPMGLRELTSYKYIIKGEGQIR